MKTTTIATLLVFWVHSVQGACPSETAYPDQTFPEVTINTSMGDIIIELDRNKAPLTVNHFLHAVQNQSYDNGLFHRVIKDYVIQAGAFKTDWTDVPSCGQLFNESGNGLSNQPGTIAMARHNEPHSAETSFFINLTDNSNLDPNKKSWGYTVFGYVVGGQDVIDKIAASATEYNAQIDAKDVPSTPIKVISVRLNQ